MTGRETEKTCCSMPAENWPYHSTLCRQKEERHRNCSSRAGPSPSKKGSFHRTANGWHIFPRKTAERKPTLRVFRRQTANGRFLPEEPTACIGFPTDAHFSMRSSMEPS